MQSYTGLLPDTDQLLVCGLLNGLANVYCLTSHRLLAVLDCSSSGAFVQLSVSSEFIAAVSRWNSRTRNTTSALVS